MATIDNKVRDRLAAGQLALGVGLRQARTVDTGRILAMATSSNAQLLELSGKRNPYPGKLGVVEEGALADLLLVDGNPLDNVGLLADPEENFVVIMKDGTIFKNQLHAPPGPQN